MSLKINSNLKLRSPNNLVSLKNNLYLKNCTYARTIKQCSLFPLFYCLFSPRWKLAIAKPFCATNPLPWLFACHVYLTPSETNRLTKPIEKAWWFFVYPANQTNSAAKCWHVNKKFIYNLDLKILLCKVPYSRKYKINPQSLVLFLQSSVP